MKRFQILVVFVFLNISCSSGNNGSNKNESLIKEIPAEAMHALQTEEDLDILLEKIGDAPIVLLGEASHGTSEFYTWRAEISKRLIREKNFNIIAVEADWADAYPVNNYVKGLGTITNAREVLKNFDRWPEWMWNNEEIAGLTEWLRQFNMGKPIENKTGFYGLDVYGIWESLDAVHQYLQQTEPSSAERARAVMECFAPYNQDEQAYARATVNSSASCEAELQALLVKIQEIIANNPDEAAFNALQNTLVAVNAETYYRTAARSSASSWNIRDRHMMVVIKNLLAHNGPGSKIIIWEHNTHIGDARATDMADAGMVNVGQLVREEYGEEEVYIVGFGTYKGRVLAATGWANNVQVMNVPNARKNSWEWILHNQGPRDKIIFLDYLRDIEFFRKRIGHRAIGVVYNPQAEAGNYVPSVLPQRYDAFIFIDQTTALKPL